MKQITITNLKTYATSLNGFMQYVATDLLKGANSDQQLQEKISNIIDRDYILQPIDANSIYNQYSAELFICLDNYYQAHHEMPLYSINPTEMALWGYKYITQYIKTELSK